MRSYWSTLGYPTSEDAPGASTGVLWWKALAKRYRLSPHEILPLARGRGSCLASDHITVEGRPVGFMYREEPDTEFDSGWRFLSGLETDAYVNDLANVGLYDVNTIANYDRDIIPLLDAPPGSAFERDDDGRFVSVAFEPPDD